MSTASSVPIWITAVNAAPGSPQPNSSGKIRRWALLEIGRNSVSPWMSPEDDGLEEVDHEAASLRARSRRRRSGEPRGVVVRYICPCSSGRSGATGLKVSRLGLGTMTWGRDTDEHEARDQLIAFAEAGGTLVDTAAGYGDGASEELIGTPARRRRRPRRDRARHQGRHLPAHAASAVTNASRGHLLTHPRRVARRGSASTTSTSGRCTSGPTTTPLEETLSALDLRRRVPAGRRTSASRTTPAGRPRRPPPGSARCPGRAPLASTQVEYSLLNRARRARGAPGAPRRSGSACCPGRRWAAACSPASTAPAPRRTRGRASPHFASFVEPYLDERARGIVEAVARAADGLGWTPLEVALVWVRDRPGRHRPDRRRPHRRPAAGRRSGVEELTLPAEIVDALDDVSGGTDACRRRADAPPARAAGWSGSSRS